MSFNLLSTVSYALPISGMRILFGSIIILISLSAAAIAFRARMIPVLSVAIVLASFPFFFRFGTVLKYYGLEMSGSALIAAWVLSRKDRQPFGLTDLGVLVFATLLGISTLVIAFCGLLTVMLFRVSITGWPNWRELALISTFGFFGILYYLQVQGAVVYQIETFPDAYAADGFEGLVNLGNAFVKGFGPIGCCSIAVIYAVLLFYASTSTLSRQFFSFSIIVLVMFCVLALLGKYPATDTRHIIWAGGIVAFVAGLAAELTTGAAKGLRNKIIGAILIATIAANLALGWRQLVRGGRSYADNDALIAWLESDPPSNIVLYFGANVLVPLLQKCGAATCQHDFFSKVNLSSGRWHRSISRRRICRKATIRSQRTSPGS